MKKEDEWKIGFVKELVEVKQGDLEVEGLEPAEVEEMLRFVCTS